MTVRLYGIANCDTCRRARRWLGDANVEYEWIDLRADGVTRATLEAWREALGKRVLINRRSKTWRNFSADERAVAEADPVAVLAAHPTLIKRPILETPATTLAGFSTERFDAALADRNR